MSASERLEDLEKTVAAMRRLGVQRWGDIELGPVPRDPEANAEALSPSPEEEREARKKRADDARRQLFASASVMPNWRDR